MGLNVGNQNIVPICHTVGMDDNCVNEMLCRQAGIHIHKEATITGTGSIVANVLQFTGPIVIMNQWAELTEVTTLTNATAVHATAYDGTNSVVLTKATGCDISGFTVGSLFYKGQVASEPYIALDASEVRMSEVTGNKVGAPFTLVPKNGADNYIRFHLTTTDNPVNFKIMIHFEYHMLDGGSLAFL